MSTSSQNTICTNCKKPQFALPLPLKNCAKCQITKYCSRECQKTDWKAHKKICSSQAASASDDSGISSFGPNIHSKVHSAEEFANFPPPRPADSQHSPGFEAMNVLLGMDKNDYLQKMSEKEVFEQLIDCFRLRCADEFKFKGERRGVYAGADPAGEFGEFLNLVESREGLVPKWWDVKKREACEKIAKAGKGWSDLKVMVEKSDIQEHYGKPTMPMTLRILGEKIYGKGFMPM